MGIVYFSHNVFTKIKERVGKFVHRIEFVWRNGHFEKKIIKRQHSAQNVIIKSDRKLIVSKRSLLSEGPI